MKKACKHGGIEQAWILLKQKTFPEEHKHKMSNVAGKAYGMNVLTPMHPRNTWINRLLFMLGRVNPAFMSGLLQLSIIHFARWFIIRRDQWPGLQENQRPANDDMLFASNLNGTWNQYIDSLSDGIPNRIDFLA